MLEEFLNLLRAAGTELINSPVAAQAAQDVKDVEAIAAKHVAAAEEDAKQWIINRLHPTAAPPVV